MSHLPLVTAVIRTYNRADLLPRCVASVYKQTYPNIEVIVMDDCSTDNTDEVVEKLREQYDRLTYIRHETNKGTGAAFNTANAAAQGKYIAFLDDDDLWRPQKTEWQVEVFETTNARLGLVTGAVQYWDRFRGKLEKRRVWRPSRSGHVYWEVLGGSGDIFGPPSVVMLPVDIIREIGNFREDMPRGCGQHYFRRVAKNHPIAFTDNICLDYYYHEAAVTHISNAADIEKVIKAYEIKIRDTAKDLEKVPRVYAGELVKLGKAYCQGGKVASGRSSFFKAIRVAPWNLEGWMFLFLALAGGNVYDFMRRIWRFLHGRPIC